MQYAQSLILTFVITAAYDIVLQLAKHGHLPILHNVISSYDWYRHLTKQNGYFDKHTPAAAALIAGAVGFLTQAIILQITPIPELFEARNVTMIMLCTFVISALIGLPMYSSGLFPHLNTHYYDELGRVPRAMITDGMSGLVVQATLLTVAAIQRRA